MALVASVSAQTQPVRAGLISGRVTDASTQLALKGARVSVAGTPVQAFTDEGGFFLLNTVPAGQLSVTVSYVGYADVTRPLTLSAGEKAIVNVAFGGDAVEMEKFVITGSLVGTARALNQQRASATLTTIVAADEIGRFPDQNAAESLQRLPGVSLYRDQGEGRFVDLRGLNYIYTAVKLDGAPVASPELGDRAIALDVLPSDSLSALEVTKVPTPDVEADGLGGSVNIKSKSAFDSTGREMSVTTQGIYTRLTDKWNPKVNATFSDILGGSIGVLAGFTWQERDFGSQNFEEDGWALRAPSGGSSYYSPENIGFRDYVINRERFGANGGLEFKPDAETYIYVRGAYNQFTDTEDRHQLYVPLTRGTVTALDGSSGTVTGMSRVRRDIRIRQKDQELYAFSGGFEKQIDRWSLDGRLGWSQGLEHRPDELTVRFRRNTADTSLRYAFSGPYALKVDQLAGAAITDPANYTTVDRVELQNNRGEDTEANVALNARLDLDLAQPAFVKFGGSLRSKEKTSDVNIQRFTAPSSFTFASVAGEVNSDYPFGFAVPRISHDAVLKAFNGNRSAFTASVLQPDSTLDDWTSTEDVAAGYAMGSTTWNKTTLIAGVRVERTRFDTKGNQYNGTTITPTRASRSYDNVLPGLHVRHDFNKQLVGRLSYSESLVRPAFGETAIFRNIADNDQEVNAGNPNLAALESQNFDASIEYYLPSLGVLSASVFHKEISNFSYEITVPGGDPAFPTYDLLTYRNGSDGKVSGLELAYQQQFRNLPAPLDGLGFMVNATFVDSEATYPTRPGESLPFIGQSDRSGNVALTYEKAGFFARVALNWRDEHLREDEPMGANVDGDRWIDDYAQIDASASYKFARHWEVFAEMTNLTNEPFRVYFKSSNGQGARLVQFEEYDWTANVGLRWKL